MPMKLFAGLVAVVLMLSFLSPVVYKLKDVALGIVIAIGVVLMLVDLWESLQSKED